MIKTNHPFKFWCNSDSKGIVPMLLFPQDLGLNTFRNNLLSLAKRDSNPTKFNLSGWQSLTEYLILYFPEVFGIENYIPENSINNKFRLHGRGKRNDKVVTTLISVKGNELLTAGKNEITQYFAESCYVDGFDLSCEEKIFNVFTDANDFHERTREMFVDEKRTILYGIDFLQKLIDGNFAFWSGYFNTLAVKNNETFHKKDVVLDEDQRDVISKLIELDEGKFQVLWPTGTGKGEILIHHSIQRIKKILGKGKRPFILNVSPRITLTKESASRFIQGLHKERISNCKIICFCSGEYDNDSLLRLQTEVKEVPTVLDIDSLKRIIASSDGPVIIYVTYHSVYKILEAGIEFQLMNCDESHNIVKGRSIPEESRKAVINGAGHIPLVIHYTATQALSGIPDGEGMENEKLFGKVISKKSPKEMIEKGKIVRPMLCHVDITKADISKHVGSNASSDDITQNAELNSYILRKAFEEVERLNEKWSLHPEKNGTKMLVVCRGGQSYTDFFVSETFKQFQKDRPDIHICGISSNRYVVIDGAQYDTSPKSLNEFSAYINNLKPEDKLIVFHIAMIGEGWNVEGINAILPFSKMDDEITSSQTLGRGMRIHFMDRAQLEAGELKPEDCFNGLFIKPFCWVCIPRYSGFNDITGKKIEWMIRKIKTEMDYYPYEEFYGNNEGRPLVQFPGEVIAEKYEVPSNIEYVFSIERNEEEIRLMRVRDEAFEEARKEAELIAKNLGIT